MQITQCPTRYAAGYESASVIRFPRSKASGWTAKKQKIVEMPMTDTQMKAIDELYENMNKELNEAEKPESIKELMRVFQD